MFHFQRRHLAAYGEIGVVEDEGSRNTVLVELERNRIDRGLLPALLRFFLRFIEVADSHWPARELCKRRNLCAGVVRRLVARLDRMANNGQRVVEFLAAFRAVVDGKLED